VQHGGHHHVLEVEPAGLGRAIVWTRDGEEVLARRTSEDTVRLVPGSDGPAGAGAVRIRFPWFGPARRVTLFEDGDDLDAGARALLGAGGVELDPEPGSPAARRAARVRAHPRLYTGAADRRGRRRRAPAPAAHGPVRRPRRPAALAGLGAAQHPVARHPVADIPWPDIPWPDIPWPDIAWPQVPWPDVAVPPWLDWLLDHARYVIPVVVAFVLARGEVRRHRARHTVARPPQAGTVAPHGRDPSQAGPDARHGRDPSQDGRLADGRDRDPPDP
jgi:hypothetical protein